MTGGNGHSADDGASDESGDGPFDRSDFHAAVVRHQVAVLLRELAQAIEDAAYDAAFVLNATLISELILVAARLEAISAQIRSDAREN